MLANGVYLHSDGTNVQDSGQDNCLAEFYRHKSHNKSKSEAAGRAIWEESDMVRIYIAGDKTMDVVKPADQEMQNRFPRQWQAYISGREQIDGEPLESWYQISGYPGLIEEMRAQKVRTVESLSTLSDDYTGRNPGWIDWRKKALAYIETRKAKELLAEQNSELLKEVAQMREQLSVLSAQRQADDSGTSGSGDNDPPSRRVGRPRKSAGVGAVPHLSSPGHSAG